MTDAVPAQRAPGPDQPGLALLGGLQAWLVRAGLWMLAVASVVVPVTVALHFQDDRDLPDQPRTRVPSTTAAERASWRSTGAALPANAPPVVLSYHDIRPGSTDGYIVSPELFERQLMALTAAGYRTLTSRQYADYLAGAPAGPRSVYLTFDDGTEGLYLYADRILRRQRMHGASYLISGRVGAHRPYYLTWAEVRAMAESGRWDFQAHTHDLHTRGPVGADRADGSLLTGRAWNAATGQLETDAEHRVRVEQDVTAQLDDFREQELPAPVLFAYPFSDLGSHRDRGTVEATASIIDTTYAGAFTNEMSPPSPTSRRAAAAGEIQRIEVFGDTAPSDLVRRVASWTAIEPDGHTPLTHPERWWDTWSREVPAVGTLTGAIRPPAATTYVQASYAPFASADWTDYRVRCEVRGLAAGRNNANVTVRDGGDESIAIRVAHRSVHVVDSVSGTVRAAATLAGSARHRVRVDVAAGTTRVFADGRLVARLPSRGGPRATGGMAVALRRNADASFPAFASLTVSRLESSR